MRWSTRNGIAISPYEYGYTIPEERQRVQRHHAHFERHRYDLRYRAVFRNLITNVYPMLLKEHEELHREFDGPIVPSDKIMIEHVDEYLHNNGVIHCIKEKRTRDVYEIQPAEWICIQGLYRSRGT